MWRSTSQQIVHKIHHPQVPFVQQRGPLGPLGWSDLLQRRYAGVKKVFQHPLPVFKLFYIYITPSNWQDTGIAGIGSQKSRSDLAISKNDEKLSYEIFQSFVEPNMSEHSKSELVEFKNPRMVLIFAFDKITQDFPALMLATILQRTNSLCLWPWKDLTWYIS